MAATMALAATLGLAVASLYLGIAFITAQRATRQRGIAFFALFWAGVGTYALADSAWALVMALGDPPLTFGLFALQLKIIGGVAGFFGLVSYLLLVYTGRWWALAPTAAFYYALYWFVEYFYQRRDPIGQRDGLWGAALTYANPQDSLWTLMTLALFVPPLFAALAYAALARVAPDPVARRRVIVTSVALIVFFASMTLGWLHGRWFWWGLAGKVLALALAGGVLLSAATDGHDARDIAAPTPTS